MSIEPKTMSQIHEARLNNYEAEKNLTPAELDAKRKADIERIEKIIAGYGLNIKPAV